MNGPVHINTIDSKFWCLMLVPIDGMVYTFQNLVTCYHVHVHFMAHIATACMDNLTYFNVWAESTLMRCWLSRNMIDSRNSQN